MNDAQKGLPEGWTTKVKTHKSGSNVGVNYKCYIAPSGCKFYTMKDVACFLGTEVTENYTSDTCEMTTNCTPQPKKSDSGPSKTDALVGRREAAGLPAGWIYERITRKSGRKDPYYIDPETGYAFRSKPDALRYLETGDILKCAIKPEKRDIFTNEAIRDATSHPVEAVQRGAKRCSTQKFITMKDAQKGLPEGWTTEVKTRKSGTKVGVNYKALVGRREAAGLAGLPAGWIYENITRKSGRKDPYYIDPETGYAFRSKPDALRYLETGDILKCAIKPKKRDIFTNEAIREATSPPTTATFMKQKAGQSSASDDLVAAGVRLSSGPSDKKEKLKGIKSSNSNVAAKSGRGRKFSFATVDALTDEGAKTIGSQSSKPENTADDDDDDDLLFSLDRVILLSDCSSDLAEEECAKPSSLTPPEGKASKRGRPRKKIVSTPPASIAPSANQQVENGFKELGNSKTQSKRKRKVKKELDTPRRSSKRLAALGAQNSEATHSVVALQHSPVKATQIIPLGGARLKHLATTEVHKEPKSSVTVKLVCMEIQIAMRVSN